MALWVRDPVLSTVEAWVTAVLWAGSLAQELPHVAGTAHLHAPPPPQKKKKKEKKKKGAQVWQKKKNPPFSPFFLAV